MFSSTPTHASVTNSDDPPYDTSGSGIPLVGIIPSTTLMLMNACSTTMLVMPDRQIAAEEIFGAPGSAHAAPQKNREQRDHKQRADQPEFLRGHGENKIGVRLGQIKKFLLAFHQARAGHAAGAYRNQRLNDVEAASSGCRRKDSETPECGRAES